MIELPPLLAQLGELASCQTVNDAVARALAVLESHIVVHDARCMLLREGRLVELELDDDSGAPPLLADLRPELDPAELAFVIRRGKPALVALPEPQGPIRSRLLIPLRGRRPLGVLALFVELDETTERSLIEVAGYVGLTLASTIERSRLLGDIRRQSDLVDNVLESIPLGLIAVDLEDRIIGFNRAAELLFGIERFIAMYNRTGAVLPERVAEVVGSMVLMTLKEEGTVNYELEHQPGPEAEPLSLGLTSSIIYDRSREAQGVLLICRDLALSREVEKLRQLDQLKDEFVHTVSHELKTPLTAILGGTEILMLDESRLDGDQQELLGIVDEGARRLRTLIDDLLDLSRLEDGRVELLYSEQSLPDLVDLTLELVASRSNCSIERDYQLTDKVLLDRDKIRQVLENLISNAVKYSPEGGTISVRVSLEEAQARVDVSDTGIGIPGDRLSKVFDKFYRVDASTTAQVEGTGLGLSITRHLIEMHGGRLWVESELGEGSTFSFTIPKQGYA